MPSWDSENSIHKLARKPFAYVAVAQCKGLPFWINYPKPCPDGGELLPEVKEAMQIIAKTKTRDSNGDLILATGHNSPPEVKLMVKEAVRVGVKHIIITHPLLDIVDMEPRRRSRRPSRWVPRSTRSSRRSSATRTRGPRW